MFSFQTLANFVAEEDLETGSIYPPLKSIREVSMAIAIECAKMAYEEGKIITTFHLTLLNRFHSNWWYFVTNFFQFLDVLFLWLLVCRLLQNIWNLGASFLFDLSLDGLYIINLWGHKLVRYLTSYNLFYLRIGKQYIFLQCFQFWYRVNRFAFYNNNYWFKICLSNLIWVSFGEYTR